MFPIIDLRSQLKVINQYIQNHQLTKAAILGWLCQYGDLRMPKHPYADMYVCQSHAGIQDAFWFSADNTITLSHWT